MTFDVIFTSFIVAMLAIAAYHVDSANNKCLTGHDIDAKIQQNYLETTTPTEKDGNHD